MSLKSSSLSVSGAERDRLKSVSCEVKPGSLSIVIGPNGCGKTTLMRALSGELSPCSGEVKLDGVSLLSWKSKELAKRRAVLPQHAVLDFPFKVNEVIALGRSPFLRDRSKDKRLVDESMDAFELSAFADRPYTTLSGGERQRVHLARVWAQICDFKQNEPAYLLLDEPTAALDLKHQRDLMHLLVKATREHQLGVIAALHDLNAAAQYADSIMLLKAGELVASGSRSEVLTQKNIEYVYDIPVAFLPYTPNGKQPISIPLA